MSKEKVERYKQEKAGRKNSLKKEKQQKRIIICVCIVAAVVAAAALGYNYGNRSGYERGYTEALSLASQLYGNRTVSGSAVASGSAATTTSGSASETTASGSSAETGSSSGK